ncbi:MAG: hypothetical protein IH989_03490 [Planctomycetes bacterium]|nr:hypothetical protein [Planctomycetota bacterium]
MLCAIGAVVAVCTAAPRTAGQTLRPQAPRSAGQVLRSETPTSVFDAYHNVRPHYAERRTVGSYQNETQRAALRGFQMQDRRENRRGGLSPFSLLSDRLAAVRSGAGSISALLSGRGAFSPARAGAFSRFGRTGRDSVAQPVGTAEAAVARRRLLMAGSSRNEPIYRALQRLRGRGAGAHRTIATAPLIPADRETPQPSGTEISLHDFLQTQADLDRSRLRREAWEHFRTGEYMRAARAFDIATSLDASDNTSRTGEMLCHVIVRANHTALAVFRELVRHGGDLFGQVLGGADSSDAASLFGDPQRALALQTDAQVRSGPSQTNPDARAMYLLVLWYLGETSEAQRGAVAFAREDPKSPYAGWPAEMQRVLDRGRSGS